MTKNSTSFEVRVTYPFDGDFTLDDLLSEAAGRHSDFSGAGACRDMCDGREHGWIVPDFETAMEMKYRLEKVQSGLLVLVREETTYR